VWRRNKRFFKTPKGLVTIVLGILILMAAPGQSGRPLVGLACAILAAGLVDLLIRRWKMGIWDYPSGAILTAAIVVMVLRAQEPWYVTTVTSVVAVLSKYCFRTQANVFNPAALAMIASYYLFHAGQSWWGAQTDTIGPAKLFLVVAGVIIASRVNKMPLVLTFLAAYFGLFTLTAYIGDSLKVAEIFRTPDLEAALYFAFIILTDPPTAPVKYRDQAICGALVAVVSYAVFELTGVVYYLLAGVTIGNLFVAWRRFKARRPRGSIPRASYSGTNTTRTPGGWRSSRSAGSGTGDLVR
jgi:Na+-translocating ferredoxin:NAD+ oxidoreductase RnfD subunit